MSATKRVLFVCTGNTCRSPMAEAMFREATDGRDDFDAASAGVAASRGDAASRETLTVLKSRNIPLTDFRSQPVSADLLDWATHVFAMTSGHLSALEARWPGHAGKFYLLGEFAGESAHRGEVPDPIGMGREAYEEVASVFEKAIPAIIAYCVAVTQDG
jgi:protein-tyrosine-phosphatase